MEADNASPPKSISTSKKNNGQLIDQILAETKAHLTKKHKPLSDESPLIANNKTRKRASVNNDSLISELVNRELEVLSKKRKRHSKELNDSGAILKKIKAEPVSEDEHNRNTQNGTALSFSSRKSDKKSGYRSLSRERDELERLFSNTATSVVNSTVNPFESSPQLKLTDLSISRIFKQEKQSSSEGEMPTPESKRKQAAILRPVREQIPSADETFTQTLSSSNSQRTAKDSTISTSTTVPFHRSESSSSDNESTVPLAAKSIQSSPVKKLVLEDKPTKRNSLEKSKSEKLQKRSNSKLLSITKKSNINISSHSQGKPNKAPINQPDCSSEEDYLPPQPVKPKRRRHSVPAPIKRRASEDSSEELTLPTPIQIKQEKAAQKKTVPVPTPIQTRVFSAPESSSEEEALPKPLQLKQEKILSVPVPIKSQPPSDSEGDSEASAVPTPMVVKQEKEKKYVSVPRPIKQRVSSGSESDSGAPALRKSLQVKESANQPKKRASAPASLGKVLESGSEDYATQLPKANSGAQNKAKRHKSHSCILMESAKKSSAVKKQKSPTVVKKQKTQLAKKQIAVAAPMETPPVTDSASDSEEEPQKTDLDFSGKGKTRRSLPEKITEKKSLTPNKKYEETSSSGSDEPVPKANASKPKAKATRKDPETESSSSGAADSSDEASDSGISSRTEEKTTKFSPIKEKPQVGNDAASESSSDEEAHSSNFSIKRKEEKGEIMTGAKAVVLQTKFLDVAKTKSQRQETESSSSDAGPSNEASDSDSGSSSEQELASKSFPLKGKPQLNNKDTSTEGSPRLRIPRLTDEEAASSRPPKASSEPKETSRTPNKAKSASSKDSPASKSLPINAARGNKRRQPSESSLDSDEAPPKKHSKRAILPEPPQKPATVLKLKSPVSAPKQQNVIVDANGLASESSDSEQEAPVPSITSQKATWIENLNKNYPGLEQQHIKTTLPENSVKYSLLLVPKHINPSSLVNLKCYLNKESPVNLNNMAYVFQPLPKKPDPVILSLKTPKLVELESVIHFKQFLPKLPLNEIEVPIREDVSLPSVIKSRHPLFGASYKKEIRLDHSVKQNLQQAVERKKKVMLKAHRKRKSKRKSTSDGVEENVLSIFNSISTGGDDGEGVAKESKSNNNVEEKGNRKSRKAVSDEGLVEKKKKKKRKIVDE